MKRLAVFCSILSILAFSPAFARGYRHNGHKDVPPPVVTLAPTPAPTTLQFGFFLPPNGVSSAYTMKFTDGSFPAGNNAVIFWEAPYNDSQIIAGQSDSLLTSFATAAKGYSNIVLALGEEVNCDNSDPWGGAYKGNTVASTITAFQHESSLVKGIDPNIKIAFSTNNDSCYGQPSASSYYPGGNYIDILSLDGFDFGGQTWDQVFDHAITPLQSLGKPIWILSEGVVNTDNQSAFITASFAGAKTFNLAGILYFNQNPFNLDSSALTVLKSL